MSKRQNSKYKLDRRMGENIWGRPKSPVNKRSYGPGQHGQRRAKKLSDYGTQLQAKQKLKGYYGNITERQFRKYYTDAARQLVSHGHVKVNGRRVTIASYHVTEKDTIELGPKAREMALVLEASKSAERDTPDFLEVSEAKSVKLLRTPKLADVPYAVQMEPHLIVEFYSR